MFLKQAKASFKLWELFSNQKKSRKYPFGGDLKPSLRSILIRVPILHIPLITIEIYVVKANVSLLIGPDFLDKCKL